MKKLGLGLMSVAIIATFCLCACGAQEPIMKVAFSNQESEKVEYADLFGNGKSKETEKFDLDNVTIYLVDDDNYKSYVKDGKVVNTLVGEKLTDQEGKTVKGDENTDRIMQAIADQVTHEFFDLQIIKDEDQYFVFMKFNVNSQSPSIICKFNTDSGKLEELYRWNEEGFVDLIGIKLVDEEENIFLEVFRDIFRSDEEKASNHVSEELTVITLDGMKIGDKVDKNKLAIYSKSDRYSDDHEYKFEEIVIGENDGTIDYMMARFDEGYVNIRINGKRVKYLDDVKSLLNLENQNDDYDTAQVLGRCVAVDNKNRIKAEFVYLDFNDSLAWIEISKF